MKRLLAVLAIVLCPVILRAQQRPVSPDLEFIDYLIGNNYSTDAVAYLTGRDYAPSDTLDFLKGLSFYTAKKLDLAADSFLKVPEGSPYYSQSLLFGAVSDAYLGNYSRGLELVKAYGGPETELKQYEIAAFSLLLDDAQGYGEAAQHFTFADYSLAEGEKTFGKIYDSRFGQKQKCPALAAAMSAVIPGAGKFYSGRKDEGIVSFLTVGIFAGLTAECWIKKGPTDWRTIVFGTLGSLFYIGNIYGSYVSVGIYNDNLRDAQTQAIVFNIHVPVRSLYR